VWCVISSCPPISLPYPVTITSCPYGFQLLVLLVQISLFNQMFFQCQIDPAPFSEEDPAISARDACDYTKITLEQARSGTGKFLAQFCFSWMNVSPTFELSSLRGFNVHATT
jgi:hypothetical protein